MTRIQPRWRTRLMTPPAPRIALGGDSVLATCYGPARSDQLASFALLDGQPRWQVPLEQFLLADALSGAELVIDPEGDAAYLVQDATVAAFAVATGRQRWLVQVPSAPPFESFTLAGSPIIAGHDLLLRSRRSRVVVLDCRSGVVRFATADREPARDLVVTGGALISRSLAAADVRAHDLTTGEPLWTHAMAGDFETGTRVAAAIAIAHRAGDGPYLLVDAGALLAIEPRTGAVRWRAATSGSVSFARIATAVVVADGDGVRGLDPSTGQARWTLPARGAMVAPLDGTTAIVVAAGSTFVADGATGHQREYPGHALTEHDRVLDAGSGAAIITTDGGVARLCWLDATGLREQQLGEDAARPGEPAPHGVVQAFLTPDGAVTLDTAHDLARFDR